MQTVRFRIYRHPGRRMELGQECSEPLFRINHPDNIFAPGIPCQASGDDRVAKISW